MIGIAEDETRHAEISWSLNEWLLSRLDAEGQAAVHAARLTAFETLRAELQKPVDPVLIREAGLPASEIAMRMLGVLAPHPDPLPEGRGRTARA